MDDLHRLVVDETEIEMDLDTSDVGVVRRRVTVIIRERLTYPDSRSTQTDPA